MNWSKAKTVLIVALLVTDVFLAIMCADKQSEFLTDNTAPMLASLAQSGITVECTMQVSGGSGGSSKDTISAAGALMEFRRMKDAGEVDVCGPDDEVTVTDISPVYMGNEELYMPDQVESGEATPAWRITLADGGTVFIEAAR